jgi:hypothetical protein
MNALLIRLIQAALNNLVLPTGIQPAFVMTAMPLSGWPALPFINVNLESIQQTDTAIGEGVENPTADNVWTLFALARRTWRIVITAPDAEERDFYRDTLLVILRIIKATVFGAIGVDTTHSVQAVSYPVAKERDGQIPGFYCADIVFDTEGNFATPVRTNYPVILAISSTGTYIPPGFAIGVSL